MGRLDRYLVASMLLLPAVGCAHMSDPCDNKPLKRTPSPDGMLVLATYHRECRSAVFTVAAVEKAAASLGSSGEVLCHPVNWRDRHPIDAVWKSRTAVAISTTDRLEKADVGDPTACAGITVTSSVTFRNERQQADDPAVVVQIETLVSELGPCINAAYKASGPDTPVSRMRDTIERGEHRSAVETLFGYTSHAACPLSAGTYDTLRTLSETFDLKNGYLAGVAPLVTR